MKNEMKKAVEALKISKKVVSFVGAGMSKESGIPTFRGEGGLLNDKNIEELLHIDALTNTPDEALSLYKKWRDDMSGIEPNSGHYALSELSQHKELSVVTQNVDGLFRKAVEEREYDPVPLYQIHGTFEKTRCNTCFILANPIEHDWGTACPNCGGLLRPDITLYGEPLDDELFYGAEIVSEMSDVFMLLGTSGMVFPAASIPEAAKREGATLIEINPEETELSSLCDITIRDTTGKILPRLVEELK